MTTTDLPPLHRVVTGHDAGGKAIVVENGPLPTVVSIEAIPGTVFHEVWSTDRTPALLDNGTRIRFVDMPPDTEDYLAHGAERMASAFSAIGDAAAQRGNGHA